MGWAGSVRPLSLLTKLELLDLGGCRGADYDVNTRDFKGGLHGDWFQVLPRLPRLVTLRHAGSKVSGAAYGEALRQLVVAAEGAAAAAAAAAKAAKASTTTTPAQKGATA